MSYSKEELELLATDPELLTLQLQIKSARIADEEAAVIEMERQRQLDDAIEGPLAQLQQRGRLWAEWSAQWWSYTAYDRALQRGVTELAEQLSVLEEHEDAKRQSLQDSWLEEWHAIQQGERKRYRVITEWFAVWLEARDATWNEERAAHQRAVDAMFFRMFEGKAADEAEIAKWEAEIARLQDSIDRKMRTAGCCETDTKSTSSTS